MNSKFFSCKSDPFKDVCEDVSMVLISIKVVDRNGKIHEIPVDRILVYTTKEGRLELSDSYKEWIAAPVTHFKKAV